MNIVQAQESPIEQGLPTPGPDLLRFTPEELEKAYEGREQPEAVRMYLAIVRGGKMNGSSGWFGPAKSRFDWNWVQRVGDAEGQESIPIKNLSFSESLLKVLDRNRDGLLQPSDLDWSDMNPWVQQSYMVNRMFRRVDGDGDGSLTSDEWNQFFSGLAGDQPAVKFEQLRDGFLPANQGGFNPGDEPSTEILIKGLLAGEIGSLQAGPAIGESAPDFELQTVDGSSKIRLSSLVGEKPIVLVFGNFTCGPFRSMYPAVDDLAKKYADQATFIGVYVREAHPTDGWAMRSNDRAGVAVAQPKTYDQRRDVASQCYSKLNMSIPLLVDDVNDSVGNAYSGMPARLYVIDAQGKVAYQGGRGPFGFKSGEMEQALVMALLEQQSAKETNKVSMSMMKTYPQPRVPLLSSEAAWQFLPQTSVGNRGALPGWARALARDLPQTTAALLELDHQCRTTEQFTPRQRGLIRLAAALENRSRYGLQQACWDLGLDTSSVGDSTSAIANCLDNLTPTEAQLTQFVSQLTRRGSECSDDLYRSVAQHWNDSEMVGIVLLTAYANYQDRLVHALALPLEMEDSLAPRKYDFAGATAGGSLTEPASRPPAPQRADESGEDPLNWSALNFTSLQDRLDLQRNRKPRIEIPTWEEVKRRVPQGLYNRTKPLEIRWSRLVIGNQPTLGSAWVKCLRVFGKEAKQDQVFEESVFWVVTRELQCFYCMGHCEMLMEVGGLEPQQIQSRTRALAEGNWDIFSPAERHAFSMASKLTVRPWDFSDQDWQQLEHFHGTPRALDLVWWISRCQFMTKVSDAFQLQLETDNVFRDFEPPTENRAGERRSEK